MASQKRNQRRRTLTSAGIVVAIVLAVFIVLAITNRDDGSDEVRSSASTTTAAGSTVPGETTVPGGQGAAFTYGDADCPKADGSSPKTLSFDSAPKNCLTEGKSYTATFDTTAGKVVVDLDTDRTPGTANNFIFLSRYHYFDGTDLFRVAQSIDIIQGGAPHTQSKSDPGPGYTIPDEGDTFTYQPGDLVMARTPAPDSAGGQFFFSTGPKTENLNTQGTYVVFGHVTEGLDVLQEAVASAKDVGDGDQTPDPKLTITSVTISER
jgi:cyclophilin family peptidyl-prolyl cis-trans isomerase